MESHPANGLMPETELSKAQKGLSLVSGHIGDSSYCYRHHPGVSCFRKTDADMMEELQKSMDQLEAPKDRENISHVWSIFSNAPANQRMLMMKGLLTQCCFPQLSEVSSIVQDLIRIDFLAALPMELSYKVLCYLDSKALCRAAQVSRLWKELADDDAVWHSMCEQHIDRKCTKCGWGLPLLERKRLREHKRILEARAENNDTECSASTGEKRKAANISSQEICIKQKKTRPWKEVYAERYKVESNWRNGRYKLKEFKDSNSVLSLQFDEQYLITGTYDGDVIVWNVETCEKVRVLKGHFSAVSCLKFDDSKLVTGSWDSSVRIWNYRTGECMCTFRGSDAKVFSVDFERKIIAAGCEDNNIKVFNFEDTSCFTLRGHQEPVNCVRLHLASGTLYSASEDVTVRVWDLNTKQCIRVLGSVEGAFGGHVAQIQCVIPLTLEHLEGFDEDCTQATEDVVLTPYEGSSGDSETRERPFVQRSRGSFSVVSERDQDIVERVHRIMDNGESKQCSTEETVQEAQRPTHLLTASLDNTIRLWDIRTRRCVRTLFGHVEGIWTIAADTFRIVSGGHDKLVKVWDVQSGRCWHTFSCHTKPVCAVGLSDTRFASGGDDGIVRMYCFDDFEKK